MNELNLRKQIVDKYVANFVSYSYYLVEPTKVEEALQDESMMIFVNFKEMMFGLLFQDQKVLTSSAQNGSSATKLMRKEMSFETKLDLLLKATLKLKSLIFMRHSYSWLILNLDEFTCSSLSS